MAVYTPLGWSAAGPLLPAPCRLQRNPRLHSQLQTVTSLTVTQESLADLLPYLTEIPDRPEGVLLHPEDRQAMLRMHQETIQLPNQHYQVPVIWKGASRPPNNRHAALAEWNRNLVRLQEAGLHEEFDKIIQHWIDSDYVEELPDSAVQDRQAFYLPYFAVLRPDKPTSPVRIVMNGKAVFGPDKISLNDCVSKGPKLINNLVEVLLGFRQLPIGVTADIKEMFMNIYMPPEDRDFHRFFYTRPAQTQAKVLRAKVHQFGSAGSPCTSTFAFKRHAIVKVQSYPQASPAVLKHTMMDDLLAPTLNQEKAKILVTEFIDLAGTMGMKVHKWASNDPSVLPQGTKQRDLVEINSPDMDSQYPEGKALGIVWHTRTDQMSFAVMKPVWPRPGQRGPPSVALCRFIPQMDWDCPWKCPGDSFSAKHGSWAWTGNNP